MPNTTKAAVDKIIQYDSTVITDVDSFIATANAMVTAIVAVDPAPSNTVLEIVERYLTAHLIGISDPRVQSEQVKNIQQTFQVKLSEGLGITHYGTMAMQLDTTGRLARWNKQVVEGRGAKQFFWAGIASPS